MTTNQQPMTTTQENNERIAFEMKMSQIGVSTVRDPDGEYVMRESRLAWLMWQSRACLDEKPQVSVLCDECIGTTEHHWKTCSKYVEHVSKP